ncbi:MAG TPA: RidA family protein [Edaphobacter sp.]|nr:RidA family protein [Edaphobacter sp.]
MEQQSRRGLLANTIKAAFAAVGGAIFSGRASAMTSSPAPQISGHLQKRIPEGVSKPSAPVPITNVVAYGNLLFFSSVGDHNKGTIEEHTKFAIDDLEKNLIAAGSSLQKVLKVNVYLKHISDYDRMNVIYKARNWGPIPPARTVTSPAGIPFDPLFEIDCIAYV